MRFLEGLSPAVIKKQSIWFCGNLDPIHPGICHCVQHHETVNCACSITGIFYFISQLWRRFALSSLTSFLLRFNPLMGTSNYSVTSNNMKLVRTLGVDWWGVTFGTARMGLGGAAARPGLPVPNITVHPSTASVSIITLLHNGPLLCGFNVFF